MRVKKCAYMIFTIIAEYRHFRSIVPVKGVQDLFKEIAFKKARNQPIFHAKIVMD